MKKTNLIFMTLLFAIWLTANTFAQDMTGRWEGTFVWAGNAGVKDDVTYDWDEEKWLNTTKKPVKLAIEIEKADEDGKYKGIYFYGPSGYDQMHFEATFADSMLKGGVGRVIQGRGNWGGYMELTLREKDGKRYLEGSWRTSEKTKDWEGRVALRHEGGN